MRNWCEKIAEYFYKCNIIQIYDINPLRFAIELIITQFLTFGTIILLGLIFNDLLSTFIYCIYFVSVRRVLQGYHAKTFRTCYFLTVLFYVFIQLLLCLNICYEYLNAVNIILLGLYLLYHKNDVSRVLIYTVLYFFSLCLFNYYDKIFFVRMCSLIIFGVLVLSDWRKINEDSYNR